MRNLTIFSDMTYLSSNFTLEEATASQTAARMGIDNDIPLELVASAKQAAYGMELVRKRLGGRPILVSSWYRCPALNAAVGSKSTSAHLTAMAIDFTCPSYGTVDEVVRAIIDSDIPFQQVIKEFASSKTGGWVHIAFNGAARQALIIDSNGPRAFS